MKNLEGEGWGIDFPVGGSGEVSGRGGWGKSIVAISIITMKVGELGESGGGGVGY